MQAHRSFRLSLFELIGVLGIVAALACVLFPVVAQARSANASHFSRARAINMALNLYAQDYESALDPAPGPLPQCLVDGGNFVSRSGGCEDLLTGKVWSTGYMDNNGRSPTTWSGAGSYCNNLVEGGQSDWRLPTEAELIKVATDGAAGHVNANDSAFHWSSTTRGSQYAWTVRLDTAATFLTLKTSGEDAVCVRP